VSLAAVRAVTRADVEDFLYDEAALLDEWRMDDWLALWTPEGRYIVPTNDNPDADPDNDLMYINHDFRLLEGLIGRLKSVHAHREYPWSTTRHVVTNVRVLAREDDELRAEAALQVWRFRNADRDCYVGRADYRLAVTPEGLRIREKRITLDAWRLAPMGAISIVL
jgi:p-cumate 2,3-dioxygenase beta subunit